MFQTNGVETYKEPVQVFGDRKRFSVVGSHKLIHRIGKLVTAILNMNCGVFEREKLSVDVSNFRHSEEL